MKPQNLRNSSVSQIMCLYNKMSFIDRSRQQWLTCNPAHIYSNPWTALRQGYSGVFTFVRKGLRKAKTSHKWPKAPLSSPLSSYLEIFILTARTVIAATFPRSQVQLRFFLHQQTTKPPYFYEGFIVSNLTFDSGLGGEI